MTPFARISFNPCIVSVLIQAFSILLFPSYAQNNEPIPSSRALTAGCWPLGLNDDRDFAPVDPEWALIAGARILEGRVITPTEKFGTDDPHLKYVDSNNNGVWDPGEAVIYDSNNSGVYDPDCLCVLQGCAGICKPVLSGSAPPAGTVLKHDPLMKNVAGGNSLIFSSVALQPVFGGVVVYDRNSNNIYDAGEPVVYGRTPAVGVSLNNEQSGAEAPSEVAEVDTYWTHFAYDKTFQVVPDAPYRDLLASFTNPNGTVEIQPFVEVEWEESSNMVNSHGDGQGSDRIWGIFPQYAWPVGDRVWTEGQWIFDCGHGRPGSKDPRYVRFATEIHPPRAVVTYRLNHPLGNSPTVNMPYTFGVPDLPITGLTGVPATEADIFVSGNGGGEVLLYGVGLFIRAPGPRTNRQFHSPVNIPPLSFPCSMPHFPGQYREHGFSAQRPKSPIGPYPSRKPSGDCYWRHRLPRSSPFSCLERWA